MSQTGSLKKQQISTRELVTMAMFTAILCVAAYISIPLPIPGSPHITVLNFVILLIGLLFPVKQAFFIVIVWMFLGITGLPVYIAGASGIGYLASAWGGYTVSFLPAAVWLSAIRPERYSKAAYTAVALSGVLITNLIGMLWLKYFGGAGYDSWKTVLFSGVVAFLPMDIVKAVVSVQLIPAFRKLVA